MDIAAAGSVLPIAVLDAVPNPILVKDAETRYVWVNAAFERLFGVTRHELLGQLDVDVFQDRQAAQCNGGDLRVLASGEVDEAEETVIDPDLGPRETITRKSRLTVDGQHVLIGVMHDITDVVEKNRQLVEIGRTLEDQATELTRLASTDPLTACLNRRALLAQAERLAGTEPIGLISLDLDHFKAINDTHGHSGGDRVLVHFVDTVRAQIRPQDLLGRLGGEEFVVALPGATGPEVEAIAERIRAAVAASPAGEGDDAIAHTVSVGVIHSDASTGQDRLVSLDQLLIAVDRRLYEAKRLGRNRVVSA